MEKIIESEEYTKVTKIKGRTFSILFERMQGDASEERTA